jgi:hypothetical protein
MANKTVITMYIINFYLIKLGEREIYELNLFIDFVSAFTQIQNGI